MKLIIADSIAKASTNASCYREVNMNINFYRIINKARYALLEYLIKKLDTGAVPVREELIKFDENLMTKHPYYFKDEYGTFVKGKKGYAALRLTNVSLALRDIKKLAFASDGFVVSRLFEIDRIYKLPVYLKIAIKAVLIGCE